MKRFKRGFTLAEVLITLAIIGVVAAISIPSVISNSQQQEFKTGLRKAVSVLNSAITMNMAIDGESPYENADLFNYLQRHMAVIESGTNIQNKFNFRTATDYSWSNAYFYTTDGMRFELFTSKNARHNSRYPLYENNNVALCLGNLTGIDMGSTPDGTYTSESCGGCGSYGLDNNPDGTTKPPCHIMVDVNGDRKPFPGNVNCQGAGSGGTSNCSWQNEQKYSDPKGTKLMDIFSIMVTDKDARPYGVAAQRAMYQAQK